MKIFTKTLLKLKKSNFKRKQKKNKNSKNTLPSLKDCFYFLYFIHKNFNKNYVLLHFNKNYDPIAFIEYSNSMDGILSNIEDYNKKRKRRVLIIFDDMISHVMSDKKAQQVLKDLFIRCRKLDISLCFLTQAHFSVPKDVRLNCTHYILFKLNNKRELQNIATNQSADIDYKDFIKIYRDFTKELYNFLTIDTTKDKKSIKNFDETL